MSEVEAEKWEGRVVLRLHEGGLQSQWRLPSSKILAMIGALCVVKEIVG